MKLLLEDEGFAGDIGELLRLIGHNTIDLTYDWAGQWERGATDYS